MGLCFLPIPAVDLRCDTMAVMLCILSEGQFVRQFPAPCTQFNDGSCKLKIGVKEQPLIRGDTEGHNSAAAAEILSLNQAAK